MLVASAALITLSTTEISFAQALQRQAAPAARYSTSCPPGFVIDSESSGEVDGSGRCVKANRMMRPSMDTSSVVIRIHPFGSRFVGNRIRIPIDRPAHGEAWPEDRVTRVQQKHKSGKSMPAFCRVTALFQKGVKSDAI